MTADPISNTLSRMTTGKPATKKRVITGDVRKVYENVEGED
jgi:hypothetical protein